MRVLLDENIDRLLKPLFSPEFEVFTVQDRGWLGKSNGELLRAAEDEFDAIVSMDANLEHQQNTKAFKLGFLIVRAHSNAYSVVAPLVPAIEQGLRAIQPGKVVKVPA